MLRSEFAQSNCSVTVAWMDGDSLPDRWEVAIGPLDEARFVDVPDAGLHEFLRTLASQGATEFEISSSGWVFRISRLAAPPKREGGDESTATWTAQQPQP